jgi:hypothetical protein
MDIKERIQDLTLDQKAKLYFMGLLRKGVIDTLPEDPKAAYIRDMMDKENPRMDPAIRSDFDDPTLENLKEVATKLGYLNEGDTYEKMAAKGKKKGNLKQGTVRKRLKIKDGEKIPLSRINKAISKIKKMENPSEKNKKFLKALNLAKTLKTTTNVNEEENPVVAKGDGMEITRKEMAMLHKNGKVRLKDGSILTFINKKDKAN